MIEVGGRGQFLNVDVELEITPGDQAALATALGEHVLWLTRPVGHASFELAGAGSGTADETIRALAALVLQLEPAARQAWNQATSRVFDIGIGQGPVPDEIRVSSAGLGALAAIAADLAVTAYPAEDGD